MRAAVLALLLIAAPLWAAGGIHDVMEELDSRQARVAAELARGRQAEAAEAELAAMDQLFLKLETLYEDRLGDRQHWLDRCREGREAIARTREAAAGGHWPEAQAALRELTAVKSKAHQEFRPSIWKTLGRLFGGR